MRDPVLTEERWRADALGALAAGDWYGAYQSAKGWISAGGGAFQLDPWLTYAASALLHGQPKGAVHSLDLGLEHWIADSSEQAALRWFRGVIVWRRLNDPKTALLDLEAAAAAAPSWLWDQASRDAAECAAAAPVSRKRTASVKAAPDYRGPGTTPVARPHGPRLVGAKPCLGSRRRSAVIG